MKETWSDTIKQMVKKAGKGKSIKVTAQAKDGSDKKNHG